MPLPPRGFFIKKGFLKKELAFYMAILKNKDEKSRNQDNVEILFVQTIVRNGRILNRQYNRKIIEAELREGEFYIKNVANT